MAKQNFEIQELINETGVSRRNIYFYVQQGILPPPQGAGLAAHYTEDHMLRLQLIPVMRGQGLRLDEIRERFKSMSVEDMRSAVESARKAQEEAGQTRSEAPHGYIPSYVPAPGTTPTRPGGQPWSEHRQTQYQLPGGVTISVPENLSPSDRQRVDQLLQAARQIFSGPRPIYAAAPAQNPGKPGSQGGNGPGTSSNEASSTDEPSA